MRLGLLLQQLVRFLGCGLILIKPTGNAERPFTRVVEVPSLFDGWRLVRKGSSTRRRAAEGLALERGRIVSVVLHRLYYFYFGF
jgi:hypothetical protein